NRHRARKKLLAGHAAKWRTQIDGVRGSPGDGRRDRGLAVEDLIVNCLIGLNIGIKQSGAATDDGLARALRIPHETEPRLKQKVVVVVRRLDAALQSQVG